MIFPKKEIKVFEIQVKILNTAGSIDSKSLEHCKLNNIAMNTAMKTCWYCKEKIAKGARKCKVCGSSLTILGWFINKFIPAISVLLAIISWGLTYIVQEKKNEIQFEKNQISIRNRNLTKRLEEEKKDKTFYHEALQTIEKDINLLRAHPPQSSNHRTQLNKISKDIERYKNPIKKINGKRYIEIK